MNEFIARNGLISQNNSTITGSLLVSSSNATQLLVGSSSLFVSSAGNVGIGTTAPETKLHIEDVTKTLTGNVAGVAQGTLSLVTTDAQAADVGPSLIFGGNFTDSSSTRIAYAGIAGRKTNSTSVNADGYLSFLTWRSTGLTEAMRITPAGFLALGATDAGVRFVNAGGAAASGPTLGSGAIGSQALVSENSLYGMWSGVSNNGDVWHQVQRNDGNTATYNLLFNPAGGNVGIGTTTPSTTLDIRTSGQGYITIGGVDGRTLTAYNNSGTASILNTGATSFDGFIYGSNFFDRGTNTQSVRLSTTTISLWTSGSQRLTVSNAGLVGIGTTSPSTMLHVSGGCLTVNGALTAYPTNGGIQLYYVGTTGFIATSQNAAGLNADLAFSVGNNAEKMRITSTGLVGIGTTTPTYRLQIDSAGSTNSNLPLALTSVDVNNRVGILFGSSSLASGKQHRLFHRTNAALAEWIMDTIAGASAIWKLAPTDDSAYSVQILTPFATGSDARMYAGSNHRSLTLSAGGSNDALTILSGSGNVGIGTNNPLSKLDVQTTVDASIASFRRIGATKNNQLDIRATEATGEVQLRVTGTSGDQFFTFSTTSNERMRITNAGNVGIGTTNPAYKLSVVTPLAATGSNVIVGYFEGNGVSNDNTAIVRIVTSAGSGTYTDIEQNAGGGPSSFRAGSTYHDTNIFNSRRSSSGAYGNINFITGNAASSTIAMTIGGSTQKGNVGIGTTSPTNPLNIHKWSTGGNFSNANQLKIQSDNWGGGAGYGLEIGYYHDWPTVYGSRIQSKTNNIGDSLLLNPDGGNVGIGTTAPNQLLHIEKTQNTYTNLRIRNNDTGSSAYTMFGLNSSGNSWGIRMGSALANSNRLDFVIDAFGVPVERMSITSGGNVGIGTTAPAKLLDVNGDVLINGQTVGRGGGNISSNTTVGPASLYSNTTGTNNVSIGTSTMYTNTTGANNVAIGSSALGLINTSANNVAIGQASLQNSTGGSNTAIGQSTLNSITSGNNNTAFGRLAGRFIADKVTLLTSIDNSVLIGYQASPLGQAQTNQIVIGYDATGLGSNTTVLGNSSTTTTAIYGNVGIGTTTPESTLHLTSGSVGATGPVLYLDNIAASTLGNSSDIRFSTWTGESSTSPGAKISLVNTAASSGGNAFTFHTKNTSGVVAERVRFDSQGNVGIGTTSPAKKLDVVGSIRTSDQVESSKVLNSVTMSNTPTDASLLLYAPTTTGNYGGIIGWAEGNVAASISAYDAGSGGALGLSLATGNNTSISERMRITSTGNVGIGTTAPTARLHVAAPGALSTDIALRVRNSADSADLMLVNGLGNVGIGTVASVLSAKLNIDLNISGASYTAPNTNAIIKYSNTISTGVGIEFGTRLGANTIGIMQGANASAVFDISINPYGGNLIIGGVAPVASAKVQIDSTTQGFLPPRMTNAERTSISLPAVGLCVYCTDATEGLYINKSTGWAYIG